MTVRCQARPQVDIDARCATVTRIVEKIRTLAAGKAVGTRAAGKGVIARQTGQAVGIGIAGQAVIARSGDHVLDAGNTVGTDLVDLAVRLRRARREIDGYAVGCAGEGRGVCARAPVQRVIAATAAADQRVVASPARKPVVAVVPGEPVIVAGADDVLDSLQGIGSAKAVTDRGVAQADVDTGRGVRKADRILADTSGQDVRTRVGQQRVVVFTAVESIIAGAAGKLVTAGAALDNVIARTAINAVVAGSAQHRVVAAQRLNGVVAAAAIDRVRAGSSGYGIVAATTVDGLKCRRFVIL